MSDVEKNIGTHKPEFDGEWVRLTELCKPKQWKTIPKASLKQDGYPVYGANGVIGYSDSYNHESETILVGCRGTCGQINVCRPRSYVTGNAMCLDELSEDVDLRYLEQFLRAFDFKAIISGSSQPQITRQGLSKVLVPVRPLDEQRTIADNLGKLSQLENLCERQLSAFDDLVKSQFVEMFGDPVEIIDATPLGSIALLKAGNATTAASISETDADGLYPCYGGNGLRGYAAEFTHEGVFPLIGRQGAQCGNVKLASGKFRATEHAVVVQPTIEIDSIWLFHYLRYDDLGRLATGAAQPGLSVKNLNQTPVSIPPIALQQQFADFVARVDKLGFDVQQQIEKLETLKQSLMQEYFG